MVNNFQVKIQCVWARFLQRKLKRGTKIKLVLIYGVKTKDYIWLRNSFYPVKRIADFCLLHNIEFALFLPEDFTSTASFLLNSVTAEDAKELIHFFNNSTFLLRGEIEPEVYTVFEQAQKKLNIAPKLTPSFNAKQIADDKKLMYQYFARHALPFAKSVFVNFSSIKNSACTSNGNHPNKQPEEICAGSILSEELFESLQQKLNTPFVAKPRFGSQGRGISSIENKKELENYLAQNQNGELIFQKFIKGGDGFSFDLRFFICGGTVAACALRKSCHQLLSNFHAGGEMRIIKSSKDLEENGIFGVSQQDFDQMQKIAVNAVKNAGLLYGSADYLILQNSKPLQFFLCEINASPGFEGIETATNPQIEIVPKLINTIIEELHKA